MPPCRGEREAELDLHLVRDRAQKEHRRPLKRTWGFYLDTFAKAPARPGEDTTNASA
jgi:hypothetical protein